MGFLKDLIGGHEAFFKKVHAQNNETNELQGHKLTLIKDSPNKAVKAT